MEWAYTFLCGKHCQVWNNVFELRVHFDSLTVVNDRYDQLGYSQFPVTGDELPGFSDTDVNIRCLIITITVFRIFIIVLCCLLIQYQKLQQNETKSVTSQNAVLPTSQPVTKSECTQCSDCCPMLKDQNISLFGQGLRGGTTVTAVQGFDFLEGRHLAFTLWTRCRC